MLESGEVTFKYFEKSMISPFVLRDISAVAKSQKKSNLGTGDRSQCLPGWKLLIHMMAIWRNEIIQRCLENKKISLESKNFAQVSTFVCT